VSVSSDTRCPFFKELVPPLCLAVLRILDFHPGSFLWCVQPILPFGDNALKIHFANRSKKVHAMLLEMIRIHDRRWLHGDNSAEGLFTLDQRQLAKIAAIELQDIEDVEVLGDGRRMRL
jgi:hypothetical protein